MSSEEPEVAVVILGATDCGKTDFISSLLAGLKATRIGDTTYRLHFRNHSVKLSILENDLIQFQQWPYLACALLCYDMTSHESLITLQRYWHQQLLLSKPTDVDLMPTMLLGLKRELRDVHVSSAVDTQAAIRVGQEMRVSHYGECSAKTGNFMKLVAEDFLAMVKQCVASQSKESYSYCTSM